MVFNTGVSFFIPYNELDPSRDKRCIFYTLKGARCRNVREKSDIIRAIELRKAINATSPDAIDFGGLQEYVLSTCCRRANHRDRMEDVGLLIPLAQRWQDEILSHAGRITSVLALGESVIAPCARRALAILSHDGSTILASPIESPSNDRLDCRPSSGIDQVASTPGSSSASPKHGSSESSATAGFHAQQLKGHPRYDLRGRETVHSTSTQTRLISGYRLSEFRPHVANPRPSDSVSSKLRAPLERRDFEVGSLYIFNRPSSPGHVKIGWTARSVTRRLDSWSNCGYIPNLLFSVSQVLHAQRVETLTHRELIKEWRRERMCKAPHCGKSHQEWFEVTPERAAEVVGYWVDFMERAQPYDSNGCLKTRWRLVMETFDKNKEDVTGKRLLDYYEKSLAQEVKVAAKSLPIYKSDDSKQKLKIKVQEISSEDLPDLGRLDTLTKTAAYVDSLLIEDPPVIKEESLPRNGLPRATPA